MRDMDKYRWVVSCECVMYWSEDERSDTGAIAKDFVRRLKAVLQKKLDSGSEPEQINVYNPADCCIVTSFRQVEKKKKP